MALLRSAFDLPAGRLLALDLGEARIGVAVSDEQGILARPLTVVRRHATRAADFAALSQIIVEQRAVGVLAGLPLGADGQWGPQAKWVRRYAGKMAAALAVPVALWDESYSTADAQEILRQSGSRAAIDAAAAAVILRSYLDARRVRGARMDIDDKGRPSGGESEPGAMDANTGEGI
jgi:putative holliday junction resolvase